MKHLAIREVVQINQIKMKYSELFCGIASVMLYNRFSLKMIHFSFIWLLFSWLYLLSLMDLLSHSFSSRVFYAFLLPLSLLRMKIVKIPLYESILATIEITILLLSLTQIMKHIYKKEMMGQGDIELLIALAFIFGLQNIHYLILISSLLGIPFSYSHQELPFVPCIALSSLVVLYFGVPLF